MKIFARGVLTDHMITYLEAELAGTQILVGDGIAPKAGGWTGGEPGEGDFVPYVVLSTGPAQKQARDPLDRENTSWLATYTTKHVGSTRQQSDWCADVVREAMVAYRFKHVDLNGDWKIAQTTYPTLGGIARSDVTNPPLWELTDQMSVWLEAHPS